jgi:hypothetical protein
VKTIAERVANELRGRGIANLPTGSAIGLVLAELVECLDNTGAFGHDYCEDTWYACPKHSEYSGQEDVTECNCGAEKRQRALAAVAESLGAW